jgi:DNA-binding SARP family transcriptional activator
MLGTLSVSQQGRELGLPASRKVRALLAYLALAPRAASRPRLCSLVWDSASDPRGELRWALSRLRSVLGAARIVTRDGGVQLELDDACVDALEIQRAARAGIDTLAPERVRTLLALFSGDFLEGLELDECPELTSWLLAQRQQFRAWRSALLERLVAGLPESAAGHWLELSSFDLHEHEHLLRARKPRPSSQAAEESYDYYLQGRQHLARMMHRGLEAGRAMFVRALELDAGYAPAWAGLATAHACIYEWFDPRKLGSARADYASRRALEAAPRLAEAHVARGLARSLSRHYDEAVGEFEAAIRLNPYLFDAYYYLARTEFACGRMARAAEMFGLAAQLRPEDFQSPMLLATTARVLGRDEQAADAVRTGIRRAEQVLALNPQDGRALSLGACTLVDDGQAGRALEWARRCLELHSHDTSALVNVACVHARVGQSGEALDLLERVFARGCGKRDWIVNDPDYASLRDEPRFQRMLSRVG